MKARLLAFDEVEVEGEHYDHDIVIEAGTLLFTLRLGRTVRPEGDPGGELR